MGGKWLNPKAYGKNDVNEVVELIRETMSFDGEKVLTSAQDADSSTALFVKLTEKSRRDRQRRKRLSQPQPLPEALSGQPLYPHVAYRNVSLQVNFGPHPLNELPFKCRM